MKGRLGLGREVNGCCYHFTRALGAATSDMLHCTENPIDLFLEMKLHDLVPNSYIHVSVSDLYCIFPGLVCLFGCNKIGRPTVKIQYINRS